MRHDVLAEMAARIGEPVREFLRLRQQHQPRVVVDERRDDDDVGFDRVVGAVGPVIRHAGHFAGIVAVDAIAHGAGDELEVAGGVGLRQLGDQDRGFRADVAAERLAEAAIGAARPAVDKARERIARGDGNG